MNLFVGSEGIGGDVLASKCVQRARKRLGLKLPESREVSLRSIKFGIIIGSEEDSFRSLWTVDLGYPIGEVSHCVGFGRDPIKSYLGVRLAKQEFLEAIVFRNEPAKTIFFENGNPIGYNQETAIGQPKNFWIRLINKRRRWSVFVGNSIKGEVCLRYPVDKSTRLFLQLDGYPNLSIDIACQWFKPESEYVIPLDSPNTNNLKLEKVYFLLAICFRTIFLGLDYCSS